MLYESLLKETQPYVSKNSKESLRVPYIISWKVQSRSYLKNRFVMDFRSYNVGDKNVDSFKSVINL